MLVGLETLYNKDVKTIFYIILILVLSGCRNGQEKHLRTFDLCKENKLQCSKLYIEVYSDLGVGLLGSDLTYDYLTDSSNFKLFIGKYDDTSEILFTHIKGDSIIVIKSTTEGQSSEWQSPKILEERIYSLKVLKKLGNL